MWAEMQQRICQVHDVDELKHRMPCLAWFWAKCHQWRS